MENNLPATKGTNLANSQTKQETTLSVRSILASKQPTLAQLKGTAELTDALVYLVADTAKFFNVGKQMNRDQVRDTVSIIKKQFFWLRLEDIKLCFENGKGGKYGEVYDRMDGSILTGWLTKYNEERARQKQLIEQEIKDAEAAKEDLYYLECKGSYIRETDTELVFVTDKEFATPFTLSKCYRIKSNERNKGFILSIKSAKKADIGLIDYVKDKNPDLHKDLTKQAPKSKKNEAHTYAAMVAQIEASDKSELEKENAKRELNGLVALTQEEYDFRKELEKK